MASTVASILLTGALTGAVGWCSRRGKIVERVSFEPATTPTIEHKLSTAASGNHSMRRLAVGVAAASVNEKVVSGVVFEPFKEVQSFAVELPDKANVSLARQRFHGSSESALNEQINVEYNASYIYHALYAYFDRDDVALPGLAKYFKESSEEEREHAEKFMEYQNQRGGRVKLLSIVSPPMDFGNAEKGDALYAMELTLSLEKLVTEKLYSLHKVAEEVGDIHLKHLVEGEWLTEQIESIRKISGFVAQLRRIGNDGHGVLYWDRELLEEGA